MSEPRRVDPLHAETLASKSTIESSTPPPLPCLTIIYHPDFARIGEHAALSSAPMRVSRSEPDFTNGPLADPYLSRRLVELLPHWPLGVDIVPEPGARVIANGASLTSKQTFSLSEISAGVVLELGKRIALLLHCRSSADRAPDLGLVGASDAIDGVRQAITRVADLDISVLIRGETGVGKEHVAQAIHRASTRDDRPLVAVNMAAIPATTAASELFGHARGAFTGAATEHAGYFARADGGSLFLDEVGETPGAIQAMLLRVLESGEIQPVGAPSPCPVDVRIIAATDADLEEAGGGFRAALLHRLAGYELTVPPLRDRRDDIARLLVHFLRRELTSTGELDRLAPVDAKGSAWFPRSLMIRLCAYDWPGNVRQLANVARQLVVSSRGSRAVVVDASVERLLQRDEVALPPASSPATPTVDDGELVATMRAHNWAPGPTAKSLGIPTSTLYDLIEASPNLRKAVDIPADELERCHTECAGDIDAMVDRLEVSKRGIRLRLKQLGLV